jgi:hypothetical protein
MSLAASRSGRALRAVPIAAALLIAATGCQFPDGQSLDAASLAQTAHARQSARSVQLTRRPRPTTAPSTSTTRPTSTTATSTPRTTPPSTAPRTTTPASATAAPTTSRPTTTTTAPAPSGRPGPTNTGVPKGTALTVVTGDQVFTRDDEVIDGKDFHGFVAVRAKNVTFRNSIFRGGDPAGRNRAVLDVEDAQNTLVQDSEVLAAHPAATLDGVWTNSTHLLRLNIHGGVDGIKTGSDVVVEASWIHDMQWFASDPNQGGGSTHNDGVQSFDGTSGVVLRGNTIDLSTTNDANATWQSSARDSSATGNFLNGGGCSLNFAAGAKPLTGISVANNRFGRVSDFHCPILLSLRASLSANSGNVFDDTGAPIPVPQQHD